jgi:DNA repair and recombination RAD54-like protein
VGVEFLLARLVCVPVESAEDRLGHGQQRSAITGAVLADDMGMGKTLTCLALVHSLTVGGMGKAIVVCPATLIHNWCDEAVKWFPKSLGKCVMSVENAGANDTVRRFVQGHALLSPLLIISYDMYRNFSNVLNGMDSVRLLACDEGHRLKNAYGTKTMVALASSTCPRRLVLTGTPIQNDLLELFAVVDFAHPGFLGTAQSFRDEFMVPIEAGRVRFPGEVAKARAAKAHTSLSVELRRILIRRTRSGTLQSVLPPCTTHRVCCRLTPPQAAAYAEEADSMLGGGGGDVLAPIMRLRGICSGALPDDGKVSATAVTTTSTSWAWVDSSSTKLFFLEKLLRSVFKKTDVATGDTHEQAQPDRVVVVSNFMVALDEAQALLRTKGWLHFRIDGATAMEVRQSMVKKFNAPDSPFKVVLLSTKAGGVGLNLIGANRLVMLDPDWNPSTDHQAMGRVWRDGQTKPVFIYRLACVGTVEESILARQKSKGDLLSLVEAACAGGGSDKAAPKEVKAKMKGEEGGDEEDHDENHDQNQDDGGGSGDEKLTGLRGDGLARLVRPGGGSSGPLGMHEAFRIVAETTGSAPGCALAAAPDSILDTLRLFGRI